MNTTPAEILDQIRENAQARADLLRELETVTDSLKEDIRAAIAAGALSELGAFKLTGVSRSTIRTWVGKQ